MKKEIDRGGEQYGRLVIIERTERPLGMKTVGTWWRCKCLECDGEAIRSLQVLKKMKDYSTCGCGNSTSEKRREAARRGVKMKREGKKSDIKVSGGYNFGRDAVCPVCKKDFVQLSGAWAYRHGEYILCSYHCMREMQKTSPKKKKENE